MRWETIALAGMLVLAGCIGASASVQDAQSLEATARDAAQDHIDDPQLVAVFGMEPPAHLEDEEEDAEVFIHLDDDPGDGEAPGWAYHFVGTDRQAFLLVNDAIGVIAEAYFPLDEDPDHRPVIVEGWEVGSQDVAEALRDHEAWPAADEGHLVFWELGMEDGEPLWTVELSQGAELFDDEIEAIVSARNGSILHIGEETHGFGSVRAGPAVPSGCDVDRTSGQVTPTGQLVAQAILPYDGRLHAIVNSTGAGMLELTIRDQDGDTVHDEAMTNVGPDRFSVHLEDLEPGAYTAQLETTAGIHEAEFTLRTAWGQGCQHQMHEVDVEPAGPPAFETWAQQQFEAWLVR